MALPESFMQELTMKTDISDIVSTYVTLKKRGSTYVGLCPFHNEKTPSFTVYPETQSFYCFGCGAGGGAVEFIKRIENLDFIDAVKLLAQRAGMQMPDEGYDDSLGKKRKKIYEINRETAKFYHSYMLSPSGRTGLDYYLNRGLSLKTINHFGLGYAPNEWDSLLKHLKSQGFSVSDMLSAGVIKQGNKGYYDNFRNRVMTPIIDVRGNVIAFGGRVLDDSKPKYINTGDTLVYKKTNELFAMNFAKDSGKDALILCEGYMDVIAMHQAGFTNAVAGCGTALTPEQVRLISRYCKEVILAYDADEAGQKALNKAIGLFGQTEVKVRIPNLTGGKDPDEIIKKYGAEKFGGMLDGASNEIEFALINARKKFNLLTTQGKIDFLGEAMSLLVSVSPIEQDLYIQRLSEELGVEKQSIKIQLDDKIKKNKYRNKRREYNKIIDNSIRSNVKESFDMNTTTRCMKAQNRLIGLLMLYPSYIKYCDGFDESKLSEGFISRVYSLVCEKIENGYDMDINSFAQYLSDDEISRLTGIIVKSNVSDNPEQEFRDCMKIINEESDKAKKIDVGSMSDDAFRNLFRNNT